MQQHSHQVMQIEFFAGRTMKRWAVPLIGFLVLSWLLVALLAAGFEGLRNYFRGYLGSDGPLDAVRAWVQQDDLVERLSSGQVPANKGADTIKFAVWVVGDDADLYMSKIACPCGGNTEYWDEANSVLIVRMKRAGKQKVDFDMLQKDPFDGHVESLMTKHREDVATYSADAWLVDRKSRALIDYKFIEAGMVGTGSIDDVRFSCVQCARDWARFRHVQ
jgi:hypothetical protein